MLVLSRKVGEEIVIGQGVSIRVLEIRGSRVRVGITAPVAIPIHRHKMWSPGEGLHRNGKSTNNRRDSDEAVQGETDA